MKNERKVQILLVDDEAIVRQSIRMLLKQVGHHVQAAESGEAALVLLELCKFELMITDYMMPGMKGDELAARVKQQWPGMPIIMVSGSLVSAGSFAGVDRLLCKPFSMAELCEAIIQVLDRSEAQ